ALVWTDPVPALWVLGLPVLVTGLWRSRAAFGLSLLPALALVALGAAAWARGFLEGTWLPLWYRAALVAAVLCAAVPVTPAAGRALKAGRAPKRAGRRGLPRARAAN
ncbi:MAG TPA: hypothetical protein VGQ33_22155, partial [Vicinamibacteria bacterium]|nr:hypothetical protein [Vicinamibacteria bacterium]